MDLTRPDLRSRNPLEPSGRGHALAVTARREVVALEAVSVLGSESAGDIVVDEIVLAGPDLLESFAVGKVLLFQRVGL